MKRGLLVLLLVVLGAFLLIAAAAGVVVALIWIAGVLGVQHALGIDTQVSKNYDSVSGYLPIIVTSLGFSGLLATAWHHLNCHQKGCWRIARFPTAGGRFKTCRQHNPDPQVREGPTATHLQRAHDEHQARVRL